MASITDPKDTRGHADRGEPSERHIRFPQPGREKLGTVYDVILDKMSGKAGEHAILSFGGFPLGIGDKYHPLPWHQLTYERAQDGYVVNLGPTPVGGCAGLYAANEMTTWDDLHVCMTSTPITDRVAALGWQRRSAARRQPVWHFTPSRSGPRRGAHSRPGTVWRESL